MAALNDFGIWRGDPIILASKSKGRARLLESAGISYETVDSKLDERVASGIDELNPGAQATSLARAKAQLVSSRCPGRIVIGADQTLAFAGQTLHKSTRVEDAIDQFRRLAGARHELHSAVACVRDGAVLFEFVETAKIQMRQLSEAALGSYVRAMGENVLRSVGGYEIEGIGANLLESIDGDIFTIIGLPLFGLLAELRKLGLIDEENITR